MRALQLRTPLPAPPAEAWAVFVDVATWPDWGRLVVKAEGRFEPGSRWRMTLRGDEPERVLTPFFVSQTPPQELVFETRLPGVRIEHRFTFEATDGGSELVQDFTVRGPLAGVLARWIRPGMEQFAALGEDLAERLA